MHISPIFSCRVTYRFLHISTKSTNTYHRKHPATVSSLPGHATIIEHSAINIYLSAACNLHVTSENHHHFTIESLPLMVLSGIKIEQAAHQG